MRVYMCACVFVGGRGHVQRHQVSLEFELQVVMSHLMWVVLGTKFGFF